MASKIYKSPKPTPEWALFINAFGMAICNNAIPLSDAVKSGIFTLVYNLNFFNLALFYLLAKVIRPSSISATASVFSHNKGNHHLFNKTAVQMKVYPLYRGLSISFFISHKGKKLTKRCQ